MNKLDEADPIWGNPAEVSKMGPDDKLVKSHRTGNFVFSNGFEDYINGWSEIDRAKICTWVHNKNLLGETPRFNVPAMEEIQVARPLSIKQKIDRFLEMLTREGHRPGDVLAWPSVHGIDEAGQNAIYRSMLWTEAANIQEFRAFANVLEEAGIIVRAQPSGYALAFHGFERLDELDRNNAESDRAFVAMWFSEETNEIYENGIKPALIDAGFKPIRIDQKEHNNKIDDEIIAEIKKSRFVVADFTCGLVTDGSNEIAIARGGVYYEAGFAQGLGLPVVWMVRSDQIHQVHFDTRQFNHITWETADELRDKLFNRVSAVISIKP